MAVQAAACAAMLVLSSRGGAGQIEQRMRQPDASYKNARNGKIACYNGAAHVL